MDRINRTEPRAAKRACSIELAARHSALRRNSHLTFSGFAVSWVLVSAAAAQQPPQTPLDAGHVRLQLIINDNVAVFVRRNSD